MNKQKEFLTLLLKTQGDVKAFIGSMIRDRQAREDLFQEVALVLWQKFDQYDPERPFGAWARGIAANKMMQYGEKARKGSVVFSPEAVRAILEAYDQIEEDASFEQEALRGCVERLHGDSRRLIDLRYGQSMKLGEIAHQEGGTLDAVHKSLSRIRGALQKCVEHKVRMSQEGF